jgi:sulfate adenylyltransferase subunit 1
LWRLPSGKQSRVKSIVAPSGEVNEAFVGQAITLTLENEIDISRGDMIVRADESQPTVSQAFDAHIVWMNETRCSLAKNMPSSWQASRYSGAWKKCCTV